MTTQKTRRVEAIVRLDALWIAMTDEQRRAKMQEVDRLLDDQIRERGLSENTEMTREYDDHYAASDIGVGDPIHPTSRPQPDRLFLAGWAFGVLENGE